MSAARFPKLLVPALALAIGLVAGWLARPAVLSTERPIDREAEVVALVQADRDFARLAQERGPAEAFNSFLADDAVSLPAAADPVHGRELIRQRLAVEKGATLTWEPKEAAVARAGDLGYTWGTYESTVPVAKGPPNIVRGKYTSIWRKDADGRWRVVLDIGNSAPPKP